MEIDIDVYFWMVDRGLFDDDQRNKVELDRNKVRMYREHSQRFENALYVAKLMLILKKSVMKIQKKPFSLDPNLANLKDNITSTTKQINWNLVVKELKKFGVRVDAEKRTKIIEGRLALINDILSRLFEFDNGSGPQSGRGDLNHSEINFERDHSLNHDSTNISLDGGKDSHSILLGAPLQKRQELDPLTPATLRDQKRQIKASTEQSSPNLLQATTKLAAVSNLTSSVTSIGDLTDQKDLGETETTLEFILVSLARNMGIKPKQAAGLLSNNHKYLVHIAVKGMKGGDYSRLQSWYQDIYEHAKHLTNLIDLEKDHNSLKLTLNILKSGLFSLHDEVVINCARVLSKMGQEIQQVGGQLSGLAWDWFIDSSAAAMVTPASNYSLNDVQVPDFNQMQTPLSTQQEQINPANESGLACTLFALKRHPDLLDHLAPLMVHYGRNNYMEMFTHHLPNQFPNNRCAYLSLAHDLIHLIEGSSMFTQALVESGVLDEWTQMAVRVADFQDMDYQPNPVNDRITALAMLASVWSLKVTLGAEDIQDMSQSILTVLKRGCRDRNKLLRTLSFELLFTLLHQFASSRNQQAPIIYKTLTFLLIEYYTENEVREQILRHFIALFTQIQSIPVTILCEPLLKQITLAQQQPLIPMGTPQPMSIVPEFNTFDFDFFQVIIGHRRSNISLALQLMDHLAHIATTNIFYCHAATSLIIAIVGRYARDVSLHQGVRVIVGSCLETLEDLERQNQQALKTQKLQTEGKMKDLQASVSAQNTLGKYLSKKVLLEKKSKDEEDKQAQEAQALARKTKEKLVVNLLKALIVFGNNQHIKEDLKTQMLRSYSRIESQYKVKSKPINYLLQLYGEDIPQMLQYFMQNEPPLPVSPAKNQVLQESTMKDETMQNDNSTALVPYSEQNSVIMGGGKKTRAEKHLEKVLQEIEKIKTIKIERNEKQAKEEEQRRARNDQIRAVASKKVDSIIRDEHGVLPKQRNLSMEQRKLTKVQPKEALDIKIIKARDDLSEISLEDEQRQLVPYDATKLKDQAQKQLVKEVKQFQLYDLRMEEQRDQDGVRFWVKKHLKILRNLFTRYANTSGPVSTVNQTFDNMSNKNQQITLGECLKMLKDFQITSLNQKDGLQMFRLINMEILKKKVSSNPSLTVLDFEGFVEFMLQVAVHTYAFNYPDLQPVDYLQKLFDHMKQVAGKTNSNAAKLFEDPALTSGVVDLQLLQELNRQLQRDPNYRLPDGFQRITEKEIEYRYEVPEHLPIKESQKVTLAVLDDFLNGLFGFHFLEAVSEVKEVHRAKPILKVIAQDKVLNELSSAAPSSILNQKQNRLVTKKSRQGLDRVSTSIDVNPIRSQKQPTLLQQKGSFATPRQTLQPIAKPPPSLGLPLKLEVSKAPAHLRPAYLECAYVLEDVLQRVSNGGEVGLRPVVTNRVREMEARRKLEEQEARKVDKERVDQRKKVLKDQLDKLKEAKDKEKQELEVKNKEEKKREASLAKQKELKAKQELQKKKDEIDKLKTEKAKDLEEKKKLEDEKAKLEKAKRDKEVKEALAKNKVKLMEDMRKKVNTPRGGLEEVKEVKKPKINAAQLAEARLKAQEQREKTRGEYEAYRDSPEVQEVFQKYEKSMKTMFETNCKLDSISGEKMSYNAYIKMGNKDKITPQIVSNQDYIYVQKTIMKGKKNEISEAGDAGKLLFVDFKEALIKIASLSKDFLNSNPDSTALATQPKKSQSISRSIPQDFDYSNMTGATMETLFKLIGLKPDKSQIKKQGTGAQNNLNESSIRGAEGDESMLE